MKTGLLLMTILALSAACNETGNRNPISDSLGNKITDTSGRSDTMNYERMQTRSGNPDSATGPASRKNDTAYYERMPQKSDSLK